MPMRKLVILAALSLATLAAASGCATQLADDDGTPAESEAELSRGGKALIGAYKDDSGLFRGLILTATKAGHANEFIADVATPCVTAPCPASERITGTFTAGSKTIAFTSTTASPEIQHLLGRYTYFVQGAKLTIWRGTLGQSLNKVDNYCSVASDCYAQDITVPACADLGFTCTPQNTCSWSCGGVPPSCEDRTEAQCTGVCQPVYGPSVCSPDGRICTADLAYKGCANERQPISDFCLSSSSCAPGTHCSTEDGVCNPTGMLAVCSGSCVN